MKTKNIFKKLISITAFCLFGSITIVQAQTYQLLWSDEFNGTSLDQKYWNYELGNGAGGWGTGQLDYSTNRDTNVHVRNGILTIQTLKESSYWNTNINGQMQQFGYTSGRLNTGKKLSVKYGKIEIRAKVPTGQGTGVAFWLLPTWDKFGGWPRSGEIDVLEICGNNTIQTQGTVHFGEGGQDQSSFGIYKPGNMDFSTSFHTFGVEWAANYINWYVDGVVYKSVDISTPWGSQYYFPFHEEFYIIASAGVGAQLCGTTVGNSFPAKYDIDYVRVYKLNTEIVGIPSKVEAETYTTQSGTGLEACTDIGGGQDVGQIGTGDYLSFTLKAAQSGLYRTTFRVAAGAGFGGSIDVYSGAVKLKTVTVPATGGWQAWQDVITDLNLSDGAQNITLQFTGQFNLNYVNFEFPYPALTNVQHTPVNPTPANQILVSANITEANGIKSAIVYWGNSSSTMTNQLTMAANGTTYTANIPAQPNGTVISYKIVATGNDNLVSTSVTNSLQVSDNNNKIFFDCETVHLPFTGFGGGHWYEVSNPFKTGINTSPNVTQFTKGIETWSCMVNTDSLKPRIDFSVYSVFQMKVYAPILTNVTIELQNWNDKTIVKRVSAPIKNINSWESLSFDFTGTTSNTFNKIIVYFDEGTTVVNTFYADDLKLIGYVLGVSPPVIGAVTANPAQAQPAQAIAISAKITDDLAVTGATLNWGTSATALTNSLVMTSGTSGYSATIPGQVNGTSVYYQIVAKDGNGNTTTSAVFNLLVSNRTGILFADYETIDLSFTGFYQSQFYKVTNPYKAGIDVSANVGQLTKGFAVWEGIASVQLASKVDFSKNNLLKMKVLSHKATTVIMHFEDFTNNKVFFESTASIADTGKWVQLTFDMSKALSNSYDKLNIQMSPNTNDMSTYFFDDIELVPNTVTGLTDVQVAMVQAFPNPFNEQLNLTSDLDGSQYSIADVSGRTVASGILKEGANMISTIHIAPGMYVLQVNAQNALSRYKLVK